MTISSLSLLTLTLALALHACSDDPDGNGKGGDKAEPFTIHTMGLFGNSLDPTAVRVDQQSDADGTDDNEWYVDYTLDGRPTAVSQPKDTGAEQTFTLTVKGTRVSDSTVYRQRVKVTVGTRP